jgi:hypothetical protein
MRHRRIPSESFSLQLTHRLVLWLTSVSWEQDWAAVEIRDWIYSHYDSRTFHESKALFSLPAITIAIAIVSSFLADCPALWNAIVESASKELQSSFKGASKQLHFRQSRLQSRIWIGFSILFSLSIMIFFYYSSSSIVQYYLIRIVECSSSAFFIIQSATKFFSFIENPAGMHQNPAGRTGFCVLEFWSKKYTTGIAGVGSVKKLHCNNRYAPHVCNKIYTDVMHTPI